MVGRAVFFGGNLQKYPLIGMLRTTMLNAELVKSGQLIAPALVRAGPSKPVQVAFRSWALNGSIPEAVAGRLACRSMEA